MKTARLFSHILMFWASQTMALGYAPAPPTLPYRYSTGQINGGGGGFSTTNFTLGNQPLALAPYVGGGARYASLQSPISARPQFGVQPGYMNALGGYGNRFNPPPWSMARPVPYMMDNSPFGWPGQGGYWGGRRPMFGGGLMGGGGGGGFLGMMMSMIGGLFGGGGGLMGGGSGMGFGGPTMGFAPNYGYDTGYQYQSAPQYAPYAQTAANDEYGQDVFANDPNVEPTPQYQGNSGAQSDNSLTGADDVASADGDSAPQSHAPANPQDSAVTTKPDVLTPQENLRVRAINLSQRQAQRVPVWPTFIQLFKQCAPGCEPINYAADIHRHGLSCHNQGAALDVFGMRCGGQQFYARDEGFRRPGRFHQMVMCVRRLGGDAGPGRRFTSRVRPRMAVMWQEPRHFDHAHFSISCHNGHRI